MLPRTKTKTCWATVPPEWKAWWSLVTHQEQQCFGYFTTCVNLCGHNDFTLSLLYFKGIVHIFKVRFGERCIRSYSLTDQLNKLKAGKTTPKKVIFFNFELLFWNSPSQKLLNYSQFVDNKLVLFTRALIWKVYFYFSGVMSLENLTLYFKRGILNQIKGILLLLSSGQGSSNQLITELIFHLQD